MPQNDCGGIYSSWLSFLSSDILACNERSCHLSRCLKEWVQLSTATADAQQAHTQANAEQQLLVKEARPDLPITMGFRPSLLGNGKVAVMQNISNSEIEVTLDVMSPATGLTFHKALVIEPHGVQQLGKAEG